MNRTRALAQIAAFALPAVLIAGCLDEYSTADGEAWPAPGAASEAPLHGTTRLVIVPDPPVASIEAVAAPPEASAAGKPPIQTVEIHPVAVDPEPTPEAPVVRIQTVPDPREECHPALEQMYRPLDDLCYSGDLAP